MKVVAIVQARNGSIRLPNKVMKLVCNKPIIEILLKRLSLAQELSEIIVATTTGEEDDPLDVLIKGLGYQCYRGSRNDLLDRYLQAAKKSNADIIVRITGDCPLVDPQMVDEMVRSFKQLRVDYLSNNYPPTYPDGLDIEIFSMNVLNRASIETLEPYDREHVTPYFRNSNKFSSSCNSFSEDFSKYRWTLDELRDLEVVRNVYEYFHPRIDFSWIEVMDLQSAKPHLFSANVSIDRNEGSILGQGQKLWKRAKEIIPGGNMLLSKRAEMFLPNQWPAYYSKSKGCRVWDLDGREYIDMSMMGIGTNTLGYGHPEVDAAVHRAVDSGNMSTLNSPDEVYLADRLLDIHPWADMVRLTRTGGEANAVAIRIARAAAGKDKVAICGYHGWHDWYLSANLNDQDGLDGHLLPGLHPNGVPRNLKDTVFPFQYNDFEALKFLVSEHDIGVIKMEVMRNIEPEDDFLVRVRKLATELNIVLIFDECTSGFRETFGGLHKKFSVEPDMAIFGKALGNGYAIAAVIGRRNIMESAQSTFISSTFWTERIGPSAAVATLKVMERLKSWELITKTGCNMREGWRKMAASYDLDIDFWGLPALGGFTIKAENQLIYKTLITQEMLKQGFLAGNSFYPCINHTPEILSSYFESLDPIFRLIKECENGRDPNALLKGPICHAGFNRLN